MLFFCLDETYLNLLAKFDDDILYTYVAWF